MIFKLHYWIHPNICLCPLRLNSDCCAQLKSKVKLSYFPQKSDIARVSMPGFCRGLEKQYLKIDQDQTICLVDTSTHASTYVLSSVIVKRNYIVSCASLSGNRRDIQRQKSGFFQHPQWWLKRMEFLGISGLDKSRPPPGAGAPQQVWPPQLILTRHEIKAA